MPKPLPKHPELSCYLLPGHTQTPADAITEAQQAEQLGLGTVWLSERFDVKDAGVICSAALSTTKTVVCIPPHNILNGCSVSAGETHLPNGSLGWYIILSNSTSLALKR